jgi:pyrroline-5-carboxylate reductase
MSITSSPVRSGRIAFLGGGNMARSLIGGLVARGADPAQLHVAEPVAELRQALAADFGVQVFAEAAEAVQGTDLWLLAVKPQVMRTVCESVADQAQARQPLVVSIAAGITVQALQQWLGGGLAVVRCMPNTPALLGAGVTGLYAADNVTPAQRERADQVLGSAGTTVWIGKESLMDAVTAVSGSGPAYVFLLAEAMQAAGEAEGLAPDAARALVVQTLLGAGRMLAESGEPAAELRRRVTSPGGTTQAAIERFQADGFQAMVGRAIAAARQRGAELAAG